MIDPTHITDNGPICRDCGSTIYAYKSAVEAYDEAPAIRSVVVQCACCAAMSGFRAPVEAVTAAELSATHRAL